MTVPPAADPAVGVGGVALCSYLCFRLAAQVAAKKPPKKAMSRIRVAMAVGLPLAGLAALVAAVLGDALALTEAGLRAVSPALADSAVGAVLAWVPTLAGVVVAVVAGYLGTFPYVRRIRDIEMSAREAGARFARWLGVVLALLVGGVGTLFWLPDSLFGNSVAVVAMLGAFAVGLLAFQPRLMELQNDVREPAIDERRRIERLCDRTGASPRGVRVLDTGGNRLATAFLTGLPGQRRLYVTDDLLATFDDRGVAAVIASEVGRARSYYTEYRAGVVIAIGGLVVGALTGDLTALTGLTRGVLIGGDLTLAVAAAWYGKRLVYAADDYAVERVGAETFAETLEAVADEHHVSYESGRIRSLLRMRPPLGDRLDRLWGRLGE